MPSVSSAAFILGLGATIAAAAPFGAPSGQGSSHGGPPAGGNSWAPPASATYSSVAFPTETATNDVVPNLSNGFPNIDNPSSALTAIEIQAHGTLPNGPPPTSITATTEGILRLIAFNELFEVAYFTALLQNVTDNASGYEIADSGVKQFVLNALTAVQAQEELHALNANGALAHFNAGPIKPCEYKFPVDNFQDAIALASTFTDVVLGTLQDALLGLATDGDHGLIEGVASVIGQEGEQNGFYRTILGKTPSALPFLTTSTPQFAFSALNQNFIVPGTCPNENEINLPIFDVLTPVNPPTDAVNTEIEFQVTAPAGGYASTSGWSIVYINQQNLPIVEPITDVSTKGNIISFKAAFPGQTNLMNGLTIAAVTTSAGPFATADDVAAVTIAGPGLIEIN